MQGFEKERIRVATGLLAMVLVGTFAAACGPGSAAETPAPAGGSTTETASGGDVAHGKELFVACAACHGPEGKGMPNLGKDFTASTFVAEKTDAELVEFLKVGRPVDDPLNTTGVMMPPKGGNPALTDQDLLDIVAFVRTLNQVQ
jgi:disulfide bond formation protein DsbB